MHEHMQNQDHDILMMR